MLLGSSNKTSPLLCFSDSTGGNSEALNIPVRYIAASIKCNYCLRAIDWHSNGKALTKETLRDVPSLN